jgi:hypothetical protein
MDRFKGRGVFMSQLAAQNCAMLEQLAAIARQLEALPHSQRSVFVKAQAERIAVSKPTLYRWLQEKVGWSSGRKKRADAGSTSMQAGDLQTLAGMQKVSVRKNGKLILPMTVATSIAKQNGIDVPVSNSQVSRLLQQRRMAASQQAVDSPHVKMRSLHPNHTHQVDPSLCVLYYMNGKQAMMRDDQFYKNKLENYAKVKLKVWRYVLTDHASATIMPWYVEAAGENPGILSDFLIYAWSKKPDCYFHGVPVNLIWDKGSANTAAGVKSLLDSLEVNHIPHTAGNARAKGSVEGANNLVETQFESRLKFSPVDSVSALNASALAWANAYNCNCIPGQDTRLKRPGLAVPVARSELWHLITAAQLRLLPEERVCREFMRGKIETRKVRGDLTITFKHPQLASRCSYDLTGCAAVNVGDSVEVSPLIYGDGLVVVTVKRYDGEALHHKVEPVSGFDRYGFQQDSAVFGDSFKSKPKTATELVGDELDKAAFGALPEKDMVKAKDKAVPFGGKIDAHQHLKSVDLPTYLPKKGAEITSGHRFDEQPMTIIAAAKQLRAELGERYSEFHLNYLKNHYSEGITPAQFDELLGQFNQSVTKKEASNG